MRRNWSGWRWHSATWLKLAERQRRARHCRGVTFMILRNERLKLERVAKPVASAISMIFSVVA